MTKFVSVGDENLQHVEPQKPAAITPDGGDFEALRFFGGAQQMAADQDGEVNGLVASDPAYVATCRAGDIPGVRAFAFEGVSDGLIQRAFAVFRRIFFGHAAQPNRCGDAQQGSAEA